MKNILKEAMPVKAERAILMAMATSTAELETEIVPSLEELAALTEGCGGEVVAMVTQVRPARHAAHFLGRGKIDEICALKDAHEADLLICDEELTGSQIRNLESLTGLRVLDRTFLILDIFAHRARSYEGRLQVELAQQKYRMSRLSQETGELSRQGGGIGTRGPGESRLETDRRHIQRRVLQLQNELEEVELHRDRLRASRQRSGRCSIAVVGYTNAGKTTLVNTLCKADLEAENKLFATLDPTVRKLSFTAEEIWETTGRAYLPFDTVLVDTVGFIRRLPHTLIHAFRSTLEEAAQSDYVLHLLNAADSQAVRQYEVSRDLLRELGAGSQQTIVVLNQIDLPEAEENLAQLRALAHEAEGGAQIPLHYISAKTGQGLDSLRRYLLEKAAQHCL